MHRHLSTPGQEAYFDFLSLIVVLAQYDSQHLADFNRAIAWEPGQAIDTRIMDFRALLKHEITHFLDTTTTAWGRQYTHRKLRMLREHQNGGQKFDDAAQVFALDTSEIELHTALLENGPVLPASCETINHELIYREEFGVCLLVHYMKDGHCCHKVPLSMLSLLEANATASEFLSLIQCAESQQDAVERQLSLEEVDRRFTVLLNDPKRLEYSVLLHLTRVHFKHLGLSHLLRLVAALARFALDACPFTIGPIANVIQRSFNNRQLGDALTMELRRDSHRQLIFFKSVLSLYGWLHHMDSDERTQIEALLCDAPIEAIRRMWAVRTGTTLWDDKDFQNELREASAEWLRDLGTELADDQIISESSKTNCALLETTSAGLISFKKMKLLNAVMNDETEVVFPNPIGIHVPEYFNERLNVFTQLESAYRTMKHERFHLSPSSSGIIRLN